ncbi:PLP-dependent transferase [Penicillium bovifimosum]|uniref:PLP-dependent transferase n=1 Tax=Penicillium bovifimosum TaxID=126998 RepID=A0A9W9GM08_9EURO|nr:PLP-dependent transferase [Penicillium bovifimosum]KAJ5123988.1 PLP-dependent transferase [Penicillium bovifimosum]
MSQSQAICRASKEVELLDGPETTEADRMNVADSTAVRLPQAASPSVSQGSHSSPSHGSSLAMLREAVAFASSYLQVRLKEGKKPYNPLTKIGRFNHYIVDPLFRWHGRNDRIVASQSLGRVSMQGENRSVLNGGSHNYAGLYELSPQDEQLQRKCLSHLPFADAEAVPLLNQRMVDGLARFFNADCCYATTTGYQSNVLGIPAIARDNSLIVMDEKCHNSIFTASYMSRAGARKRFRHNDMAHLQSILESTHGEHSDIIVVVEGLYSMDGTIPPLDRLYGLKKKFNFTLYADEAHSFGSIGKTGGGCLEMWNDQHPEALVPGDVIDVRSAVLSKAVGGLGGFVCAAAPFQEGLRQRAEELAERGESLTTSTMLQTLSMLRQPRRLVSQLHRLLDLSRFCHEELARQGVHVYGDVYVPMLPVYGGRPSKAAELSHVLRQQGLVASPVSAPAVEIWESRVRVTLSASYSDEDVNALIDAIITASQRIGLSRPTNIPRQMYRCAPNPVDMRKLQREAQEAHAYLSRILQQQIEQPVATQRSGISAAEIAAGHAARQMYGLGSGSARWILGTFPPHLEVEELTAQLTRQPAALTYPDSDLGLMSTIAGLCRPVIACRRHYFLVPANLPSTAEEGFRVATKNSGTVCLKYADRDALVPLFEALSSRSATYLTLYLDPVVDGGYMDLMALATQLAGKRRMTHGMTVLLNDTNGLGRLGPSQLGIASAVDLVRFSQILSARILVSESFYRAFSLPGGYLAGDPTIIEELRYTSRCYMFTTSPQPFVMAMVRDALHGRLSAAPVEERYTMAIATKSRPESVRSMLRRTVHRLPQERAPLLALVRVNV